jgi:hypothetical protein
MAAFRSDAAPTKATITAAAMPAAIAAVKVGTFDRRPLARTAVIEPARRLGAGLRISSIASIISGAIKFSFMS